MEDSRNINLFNLLMKHVFHETKQIKMEVFMTVYDCLCEVHL